MAVGTPKFEAQNVFKLQNNTSNHQNAFLLQDFKCLIMSLFTLIFDTIQTTHSKSKKCKIMFFLYFK